MGPEIGGMVAQGSGYALASAASVAMMLMVGFLVLARSPSSLVNRSFMGIIIASCLWMGGRAGTFGSLTAEEAASWHTLSFVGLAFLPPTIFLFACAAAARTKQRLPTILALFILAAGFAMFRFVRPAAMGKVVQSPYTGWYPRLATGGYFYLAFLIAATVISLLVLLRSPIARSAIQRREKSRTRVILLGMGAGYTALFDVLPGVGLQHPPIAHFSLLVGIALCGYAIGRYRVVVMTPSTTGEAIASTMQEALFFLDLEGRILFTNRALNALLGYREEDLNGEPADALFAPDTPVDLDLGSRGRGLAGVKRAVLRTRNGGRIPATITVSPYFDEEGDTAGFVGLALDQVERKQLEDRVADLEREVESILNTSMFGVYMFWEGTFQFVNEKAASMLGYTRDEIQGVDLKRLIHPEDYDMVASRVASREQGGNPDNHYVLRAIHKSGETRRIEIFSMAIPRGGSYIVLGFAEDVTDQIRSDEEVHRAQEFGEWILRNIPAGVLITDREGRIVFANATACGLLGADAPAALEGRHVRDTALGAERALGTLFREDSRQAAGETDGFENLMIATEDGRLLNLSMIAAPPSLGIEGDYFLLLDRPRESGRKGRARRSASLGKTSGNEIEWVRLLLGGVSRDLEGLLGGILGYASLARALLPGEEKVSAYVDSITESAQKTLDILGQFGPLRSRSAADTIEVPVNDAVRTAVDRLRSSARRPLEIDVRFGEELPPVRGIRAHLEEAFFHLGWSAVDALPEGGRLSVETREVHMEASAGRDLDRIWPGRYVCMEIRDAGAETAGDLRRQSVDPFGGAGEESIGLWLARSIIRGHGGAVTLEGGQGEGATYRACLPVHVDSGRNDTGVPEDEGGMEGRVLIVDDEPAVREVGSELLEELGYEVHTAPNGADALDVIQQLRNVDVVVLDMVMPKLNGEETFERLQEFDPSIKVVISSGYTEDEKVRRMLERGATAFVQKPYRAGTLARAVREAMEMRSFGNGVPETPEKQKIENRK